MKSYVTLNIVTRVQVNCDSTRQVDTSYSETEKQPNQENGKVQERLKAYVISINIYQHDAKAVSER